MLMTLYKGLLFNARLRDTIFINHLRETYTVTQSFWILITADNVKKKEFQGSNKIRTKFPMKNIVLLCLFKECRFDYSSLKCVCKLKEFCVCALVKQCRKVLL